MSHRRKRRQIERTSCVDREFFSCPPGSRSQAKKLLELAKHDLDASNLLREKMLFALSVFHMQQGFEKALKAEMYLTGLYSDRDIKAFGHDVLRASEDFQNKMSEHYRWGEEFHGQKELYDSVRKNRDVVVRMNYSQIKNMLYIEDDEINAHRERLRACGFSDLKIQASDAVNYEINILSVLLAFHEQSSRYLDARDSSMTPFDYVADLGIVEALPDIGWKLELIIGELEGMIVRSEKQE